MIITIPKYLGAATAAAALLAGGTLFSPRVQAPAPTKALTPPAAASSVLAKPKTFYGTSYEPLQPGARLTYVTGEGEEFVREVMQPIQMIWFDGTLRELIPVHDSSWDGYWLYRHTEGEIRVVGSYKDGKLERWGEYIRVLPAAGGYFEPVETPARKFDQARLVEDKGGKAWYAEGIGLVKTDRYELVRHEMGAPRASGL